MKLFFSPFKFWLLVGMLVLCLDSPAPADHGPMQTVNRFPLHLMFLKPRPVKAQLPAAGEADMSLAVEYSNTFFKQRNAQWDVLMDMEIMVLDISMVYGVTSKWAARLDLPLVSMNDGFLDGFLGNYHDAIGVGNYGRESRANNTFGYQVLKDGRLWLEGESGAFELTDITLSAQYALIDRSPKSGLASTLLFSVKVPVGDESLGFGSGAYDMGIYWPSQWSGEPWSFYVMPGAAFIGDPETSGADVAARNSYALFGGLAYDYNDRWTWLGQLTYYSSPIEMTGISELDDGTLSLDLGFHYQIKPGWIVEFAFVEDLTRAVPDFNLRLGLRWTQNFTWMTL